MQNGNWIGLDGSFTTTDGQEHHLADVWFSVNKWEAEPPTTDLPKAENVAPVLNAEGLIPFTDEQNRQLLIGVNLNDTSGIG